MDNIIKTIKSNDFIQIAIIAVVFYFVYNYIQNKSKPVEHLDNVMNAINVVDMNAVAPVITDMSQAPVIDTTVMNKILGQAPGVNPTDLLPSYDKNNAFANENPVDSLLKEQSFLISSFHQGIDTVVQSHKIPYHDIRSIPPIPKDYNTSPWNMSSFETPTGFGQRSIDIGAC